MVYIGLFRLDVVEGEESVAVADAASPPLALPLRHQDGVARAERQVAGLGALVSVQSHALWCGDKETHRSVMFEEGVSFF